MRGRNEVDLPYWEKTLRIFPLPSSSPSPGGSTRIFGMSPYILANGLGALVMAEGRRENTTGLIPVRIP
jgi:hypothetical protein